MTNDDIEKYSNLNPEYMTFHIEVGNTLSLINKIKSKNIKVGLSISPKNFNLNNFKFVFHVIPDSLM